MSSATSQEHLAAILPSRGSALKIINRPTPTPGPNEVLIQVKSIALNPMDRMQLKLGFPAISYPAILGSDVAGTVISVGSSVPAGNPTPGTRVAAFAPTFYTRGAPDTGAFQTRVLVPSENVVPLPDGVTFNEGSLLPMAVQTVWCGWRTLGLPDNTMYTAADKKGILVWGAGGSIGSMATQISKSKGFIVYATASVKHHEYLKTLGAHAVFDYNDPNVVANIVKAVKADGVTVETAFLAAGQLKICNETLKQLKTATGSKGALKVASAPWLMSLLWWKVFPRWGNVEVKFIEPPSDKERSDFFHFVFRVWLKEKLAKGEIVASPKIRVIEGGLHSIEKGLEELKSASGVKFVYEV